VYRVQRAYLETSWWLEIPGRESLEGVRAAQRDWRSAESANGVSAPASLENFLQSMAVSSFKGSSKQTTRRMSEKFVAFSRRNRIF
jgi:hypothetical protein